MGIGTLIPWRTKIAAKLVLSRIPANYAFWRGLNLFRHGAMHDPDYALGVFRSHLNQVGKLPARDFVALELGPGDSLLSAVAAKAHGARQIWLVDVGRFAAEAIEPYRVLAQRLQAENLPAADLGASRTLDDVLSICNATYATTGLEGLRAIHSQSVDFLFSHAVLEHVRRTEFAATIAETFRVLAPGGVCSHCIDLQDHLGGRLNNLRFAESWWEHESVARSGFYTNRLRFSQILTEFRRVGFECTVVREDRWQELPTPRRKLDPAFRAFDDRDLNVRGFSVVLRKPDGC